MWCIVGDVHFGVSDRGGLFFGTQKGVLLSLLSSNVKKVFFLGDVFDKRTVVKTKHLLFFKDLLDQLRSKRIEVFIVAGNHDFVTRTDYRTVLENFSPLAKVIVKPTSMEIDGIRVSFLPWPQEDPVSVPSGDILLGHIGVKEFSYIKNKFTSTEDKESKFSPNSFKDFKRVFLGHYHQYQEKGNICFVGSICQLTWNDIDVDKFLWFFNPSDFQVRRESTIPFHKVGFFTQEGIESFEVPPDMKIFLRVDQMDRVPKGVEILGLKVVGKIQKKEDTSSDPTDDDLWDPKEILFSLMQEKAERFGVSDLIVEDMRLIEDGLNKI